MSKLLRSAKEVVSRSSLVKTKAYINGNWIASEKTFPVLSPASREIISEVTDVGAGNVRSAIEAASTAFKSWSEFNCKERSVLMNTFYRNVLNHKEELAQIMTAECGKPIRETRVEVNYGASFLEWFAEEAKRIDGDVLARTNSTDRRLVFKQPIGIVGLITPWNFPLAMITRKVGAAMAAGCTSVIKPSEETPLTALAFAAIAEESGIPPGVLNVLPSSRQSTAMVGDMFCNSPDISKISFTGSTAVGKLLLKQSADTVKRVSMELGGNAPFIVFNSADIENVKKSAMFAKFRANGQTCISPNRFIVQSGIHAKFVEEMTKMVQNLKVGDPFDDDTEISSLINEQAVDKVERHVNDAVEKGCKLIVGGGRHELSPTYYKPTIVDECSPDMMVMTDETFGPVIPITKFETEEEAIQIANNSRGGLAGYLFSRDVSQIFRVSEKIEAGMVGVNEGAISSEMIPFGGVKESGIGREGSKYGVNDYLELKYVCLGGI